MNALCPQFNSHSVIQGFGIFTKHLPGFRYHFVVSRNVSVLEIVSQYLPNKYVFHT